MEQLHNGYTLKLGPDSFPLSTDSVILSGFVKLARNTSVLDLGSGCGTLGVLLCAENDSCRVTGIEFSEQDHLTALENIERNALSSRLTSICGDIREISRYVRAGSFSACVSNPPYFAGGPASLRVPDARRENQCSLAQLFQAAAWAVKYGGDFFLVHRPERLAELCALGSGTGLEPKKLCTVRHDPDAPVALVLLQCRKGAKPGLQWQELCLFDREGQPTEAYRKIYHL